MSVKQFTLGLTVSALIITSFAAATPVLAAGGGDLCVDPARLAQSATCGDGICDPYMGETALSCPSDCLNSTPSSTLPALLLPTGTATSFVTATGSATAPSTPTPTETPVSSGTPLSTGSGLCDYVSYQSRTREWQTGYAGVANKFVPNQPDHREVYVCTVPPVGQVCLPEYIGLVDAAGGSENSITLVDCTSSGQCSVHRSKLTKVGNLLCADVVAVGGISCTGGCALAPEQLTSLIDLSGVLGGIPAAAVVPIACLLTLLLIAAVAFLIFLSSRARRREFPTREAP